MSLYLITQTKILSQNKAATLTDKLFTVVDRLSVGGNTNYEYGYGPSIIKEAGTYHVFFCSPGGANSFTSPTTPQSYIRYTSSTDLKTWSVPIVKIRYGGTVSTTKRDLTACDPSVVFYNGFYYMFYSSAYAYGTNLYHSNLQVARSATISGNFLTYTDRGTWEQDPADPKIIIDAFSKSTTRKYGAGQPTAIVKDGKIWLWYTDDTDATNARATYFLQSTDPTKWSTTTSSFIKENNGTKLGFPATNELNFSTEVKYDPDAGHFVMFLIRRAHEKDASFQFRYSSNGVNWDPAINVFPSTDFVPLAASPGVSGDRSGFTIASERPTLMTSSFALAFPVSNLYGLTFDFQPVCKTVTSTAKTLNVGQLTSTITVIGVKNSDFVNIDLWSSSAGKTSAFRFPATIQSDGSWKATVDISKIKYDASIADTFNASALIVNQTFAEKSCGQAIFTNKATITPTPSIAISKPITTTTPTNSIAISKPITTIFTTTPITTAPVTTLPVTTTVPKTTTILPTTFVPVTTTSAPISTTVAPTTSTVPLTTIVTTSTSIVCPAPPTCDGQLLSFSLLACPEYVCLTSTPVPTKTVAITPTPSIGVSKPIATSSPVISSSIFVTTSPVNTICGCESDNFCSTSCSFSGRAASDRASCDRDIGYGPIFDSDKKSYCLRSFRTEGDADGDGQITPLDYFYYRQAVDGGKLPPGVNPDFNGDAVVSYSDRVIVIATLSAQ